MIQEDVKINVVRVDPLTLRHEELEAMLQIVADQRERHLRRHPDLPADTVFEDSDMKEVHKEWICDYYSWMTPYQVRKYERYFRSSKPSHHQVALRIRAQAFSAYLSQVTGNKRNMLLFCIQHSICSAEAYHQMILRIAMDAGLARKCCCPNKKMRTQHKHSAAQPVAIIWRFIIVWESENSTSL